MRNYRRRCNDGGNEIDGKEDATAAAKPSSSECSKRPKRRFTNDVLDHSKSYGLIDLYEGSSHEFNSSSKDYEVYDDVFGHSKSYGRIDLYGGSSHDFDSSTKDQCPASSSSSSPSTVAPLEQQSWDLWEDEGKEMIVNGEPLRSIGMDGLFHVFLVPRRAYDKKAPTKSYPMLIMKN